MNANAALSVMKCKLLSAQTLIDVLNVMCAKMAPLTPRSDSDKNEEVRIDFSDTGMTFHVTDKTKSLQVSSHMPSALFDAYSMEGQTDSVSCTLEPFSKCVSIFGSSKLMMTTLQMAYSSDDNCIKLILDENELLRQEVVYR